MANPQQWAPGVGDAGSARAPNPLLWLLFLFVAPGRFFTHFATLATPFATIYAAVIVGFGDICFAISNQRAKQEFTGRARVPPFVLESWSNYWLVCLVFGSVGAAACYWVGGWWFRRRLFWSGDKGAIAVTARRMYVFTTLITALPLLLVKVVDSMMFSTPLAAETDWAWTKWITLLVPFWAQYVADRGVSITFSIDASRARVWFLMVPCTYYAIPVALALST